MSFPVGQVRYRPLANGSIHVEVLAAEGYPTMCGRWWSGPPHAPLHPRPGETWTENVVTLSLREHCDHEGPYYCGPRETGWEEDQ
jgi:hypothetical protein